ncbi:MAG: citrate lyase holo-[acyl-carrier protein] synthase [Oscillospiraceae bacterium]|nr:MAG: citrate lyase holo-[acyl-carrier protein] synthase [Oscillospiraceae bacterium]
MTAQQEAVRLLLEARERRAQRQALLLEEGGTLVCLTMNIPGLPKISALIGRAFLEGARWIDRQFSRFGQEVKNRQLFALPTGDEGYWLTDAPAGQVKRWMVEVEEFCGLGRLLDIDVLDRTGGISRQSLGLPARRCLICGGDARLCARGQLHPMKLLRQRTETIIRDHFAAQRADEIAALCCKSMLYEVSVTPKPGLVDRRDNGAHRDMDFFTFLDSASVLAMQFRRLYRLGRIHSGRAPAQLFSLLRFPGLLAEDAMYAATGRVNTHKGLIFSLGILCAAIGWHDEKEERPDFDQLLAFCGRMVSPVLSQELASAHPSTGGERLFAETGRGGIRQEACAGYPTVRTVGLPALRRFLAQGYNSNDAGVYTLLAILAAAEDSNIYARRGETVRQQVKQAAARLLDTSALPSFERLDRWNQAFSEAGISPGGSADLLALCYFGYFYEQGRTLHERENSPPAS